MSVIELSESAITSYYVGGMSDGQIIPGLTDGQTAMLRKRAAGGEKKAALARELGISRETLYQYLHAQVGGTARRAGLREAED